MRKFTPDRTRRQIAAQPRKPFIDRRAHRREPHELREPPLLCRLDQVVHSNTAQPRIASGFRLDVGGNSEIDEQWRPCRGFGELGQFGERLRIEHGLTPTCRQHQRTDFGGSGTKGFEGKRLPGNGSGKILCYLERAVDDDERHPGLVLHRAAALGHR